MLGNELDPEENVRGFLHRFLIFGGAPGLVEPSWGKSGAHGAKCSIYLLLLFFGLASLVGNLQCDFYEVLQLLDLI